mgnify:CR=1 FL=1
MKKNGILIGIIGLILIILSKSGMFKHEVIRSSAGFRSVSIQDNTMITYPLMIIGIILLLIGALKFSKTLKK